MASWYEESFGEDYLLVYRHRDRVHADREMNAVARWLDLQPGEEVLDLCCGTGRHSIPLQKMGFRVTGIDLSDVLLKRAEEMSRGMDIRYLRGDMRSLPFDPNAFDAVVNLFTSFGYFAEDEDNRKVLSELARVLKPGGRFLVDFLNRESVERSLVPESEREVDGTRIREKRWIDGEFVRKTILVTDERGERRYQERVKMYDRERMEAMMDSVGLAVDQVKGDFEGHRYSRAESPRMIFVGRIPQ
ncbi:class I SAM-dependent methyltransferase [Paludifilum halophilum]|uniref:class I SAM-dependent methyltransferase n=1 Tax=Paludifilum halophilum TaxID=1642702 RepID=UPI00146B1D3E|nr:class I SAM-dependent methyltransferase [Paludifilum halophilum]